MKNSLVVGKHRMPSMTLPDFDKLWDYAHPDETERKFNQLLPQAREANDRSYLAQLLTQIARTQGLQQRFDDAHRTLDQVESMLTDDLKLARARYLLERGRVFNSSEKPQDAMVCFTKAYQRAWLWSLYNNIAESYALLHEYQTALEYVLKLLEFQKEKGEPDPYTLKDKARFLRLTGHPDQALPIIQPLAQQNADDKWFAEE